jgi:hypothetical protein
MEEKNIGSEEIKIEENQINNENENISEKKIENENILNQNLNKLEPANEQPKEKKKSKGFTRILRSIIKKNNEILKNILKTRFTEWRKEALKGLKVKKTIFIRISVSKEKDYKNRNMKLDEVKEKEKSKSINKSFRSPKDKNTYNIVREKIDDSDNVNNNNIKIVNTELKNNNEKKYQNNNNIVIEKNNYINIKGEVDKNKEIKKDNNNTNLNPQKTKLINISNEKPKYTPQANRNVRNQIIDSKSNLSTKFIKIDNTSQKNKINGKNIQNLREKVDSNKKQPLNLNNIGMSYSSSTTKKNNKEKEQKNTSMNNGNLSDSKTLFNSKNQMKGNYIKNNGYHDNKTFDISKSVNLNDKGYASQTTYKKIDYRKNVNDMNRTKDISSDINLYSRKTYQVNKNKNVSVNNNNSSYMNYNSRIQISSIDKEIDPEKLKNGVTTVIQHYEGKSEQLQNYENNSFINQKDKK